MSDSATLWTLACQAALSTGFFRQEYWNGQPCPPQGDLSDPGFKPTSPALQVDSLLSETLGYTLVALVVKNLPANVGDIKDKSLIPGLGRSPGGGCNNLLQYSCLENPMDREAWQATVHWVAKSQTQLQ